MPCGLVPKSLFDNVVTAPLTFPYLFVFLDEPAAVRASGARYLVFHSVIPHGKPFPEAGRCLARLEALYGPPMERDDRVAVFDLRPGEPAPKLQ